MLASATLRNGAAEVVRELPLDADLVVLNTCYVRENAVDRVRGHLGELNRLKREGQLKKIALTGCIGAADVTLARTIKQEQNSHESLRVLH